MIEKNAKNAIKIKAFINTTKKINLVNNEGL